jgi:hypothetical protein
VKVLEYGTVLEIVFQDTDILGAENHPMHLHGFAFYVVGRGLGNFNATTDPAKYNLIDPPYQNTVTVPTAGWAAMRFKAENPGKLFLASFWALTFSIMFHSMCAYTLNYGQVCGLCIATSIGIRCLG